MKHLSAALTFSSFMLMFILGSIQMNAQERQLVKAKEEIIKSDFEDAKERLDKYAEKSGRGAEYQYVLYLWQSRQVKSYQDHVEAYETYQACFASFGDMAETAVWCEQIQLCDTMFANETYRCYMVGYKLVQTSQSIDDVEDYLVRFDRSPMKPDATRLRDKLRLDEANLEHSIRAYETFKSNYKTPEYVKSAQDSIFSIAYKNAVTTHTIDGYKSFMEAYPNAGQISSAKDRLIELEWNLAVQTATIDGYKSYISSYPNSKYDAQAKDTIESLEWSGITKANTVEYLEEKQTVESIRQFISERPESPRISEANLKLEDAIWAQAVKTQSEADIRAYIEEFPSGKYLQKAQGDLDRAVWLQVQAQPSITLLESYIREFKTGIARQEAEVKLEELYWQNALTAGTAAAIEGFIQKYPTSKFKDKALDRIDDLKNFVLPFLNNNHQYQLYNVSQSSFVNNEGYDDMIPTSAKSFVVKKFNKYGVISKSGAIILPIKFDCMSFDGTFYQAEISGKIALMGLNGEEVNSARFSTVNRLNEKYYAVFEAGEEDVELPECSIMDMKGEILLPFDYTSIYDFKINNNTVAYIATKSGGLQYLMDADLKIVSKGYKSITTNYGYDLIAGNELYIFNEGGKFGVMNAAGKPLIAAAYDELSFFRAGLLEAVKAGKRGIIKSDNTSVFTLGNYHDIASLSARYWTVTMPNAKNQWPFFSKVYDAQNQRFISEVAYESVSILGTHAFEVFKDNKKYVMNDEGKVILTIDEFTNSTPIPMGEEGDGYGGEGMYDEEEYYCYPSVSGIETIERIYDSGDAIQDHYEISYYSEEKGGFTVYLDTNFKVINKPQDKFSKLLGTDLSFGSYVPSMDLLFAYDEQYDQYVFDMKTGKKNKSAEDFRIMEFYPGYYTAYWKDALIYYPGEDAKALVGEKVDFSKFNASKAYNEGMSFTYQGDYNSAITKFRESLKVFSNYADAYFQMGLCYASMSNNYEAQKNYKEAIRLDPRNSYYIETLYEVLAGLREWDSMLSTARSALSSGKEENALDYFYMGLAYHSKQMMSEAISAYSRAIELDQYLAVAYHNRGLCKMYNRNYDGAIKDITIAIGNCKYCDSDRLGNFNQNLGDAYNLNSDKNSACKYWQKAYKLSSKYNNYLYRGCK
jgi:tetratricopeptide (TPR) repeat protein